MSETTPQDGAASNPPSPSSGNMLPVVFALVLIPLAAVFLFGMLSGSPDGGGSAGSTVTTASGLKYIDMQVGTGKEARTGNNVAVHYTGWLENGKKFDSSLDRNEPFTFTIGRDSVIKGWHEGIVGMKEGGKRKLIIPPALAYGPNGRPPVIPPAAQLTFDVELIRVK